MGRDSLAEGLFADLDRRMPPLPRVFAPIAMGGCHPYRGCSSRSRWVDATLAKAARADRDGWMPPLPRVFAPIATGGCHPCRGCSRRSRRVDATLAEGVRADRDGAYPPSRGSSPSRHGPAPLPKAPPGRPERVLSTEGRLEGTRLPAGLSFTSCLPGACFTSCLPGSASPPACRGPASPPACRGRSSNGNDRRPLAPRLPDRPLRATKPARRAHSCQVAPLVGQKTRHLPTATRPRPDRLDNPNRPVSVLSNSEPALCALAPAPDHQAPPVPVRWHGFASSCARVEVAAATSKPARRAPASRYSPGETTETANRHPPTHSATSPSCPPALPPAGSTASDSLFNRMPGGRPTSCLPGTCFASCPIPCLRSLTPRPVVHRRCARTRQEPAPRAPTPTT